MFNSCLTVESTNNKNMNRNVFGNFPELSPIIRDDR